MGVVYARTLYEIASIGAFLLELKTKLAIGAIFFGGIMGEYKYETNVYSDIVILTVWLITVFLILGYNPIRLNSILIYVLVLIIYIFIHHLKRVYFAITINEDNIYVKRRNLFANDITEVIFFKQFVADSRFSVLTQSQKYVTVTIVKYRNSKQKIRELRFIPEYYCDMYKLSTEIINFLNRNNIRYSGEIIFYNQD